MLYDFVKYRIELSNFVLCYGILECSYKCVRYRLSIYATILLTMFDFNSLHDLHKSNSILHLIYVLRRKIFVELDLSQNSNNIKYDKRYSIQKNNRSC